MTEILRYRKRYQPLGMLFDGTNVDEVDRFTCVLGTPGGFRPLARPIDGFTAEVYDYLHDTWVKVAPGMTILRGSRGEHYPIAAQVLADDYDRIEPVATDGFYWGAALRPPDLP